MQNAVPSSTVRTSKHRKRPHALNVILVFLLILTPPAVFAERAPEQLHDPEKIAQFYRINRALNCYCGCNTVVSECGHVDEGCFAVQMRRFVERRIQAGQSDEQILNGLQNGYGDAILEDAQMQNLVRDGHRNLAMAFVEGFGPSIIAEEPSRLPVIFITLGLLVLFTLLFWAIRRRPGTRPQKSGDSDGTESADDRDLQQAINRLDQ
ncbi:MAG: cytochrome c-type biogenesis protein CcmH [Leptospiraceae bacterium]|nr:cytochrome c-type biogenesis protein CcmH [Leptospiraceae bacterium]